MSAVNKYEEFHGKPSHHASKLHFHVPKQLVFLGEAVAIEYRCSKKNGGGDGKMYNYRHEFETPAIVCMDETGRKQLYITGTKLKVTEAGIEN